MSDRGSLKYGLDFVLSNVPANGVPEGVALTMDHRRALPEYVTEEIILFLQRSKGSFDFFLLTYGIGEGMHLLACEAGKVREAAELIKTAFAKNN